MKLLSVSGQTRDWLLAAVVVSFQARADAQTPRSNNVSTEEIAFAAAVGATFPEWGVTPLLDPSTDNDRWQGIAFAENTGKLYCGPTDGDAVLVVNPVLNTTSILSGIGSGSNRWNGIVFAPNTGKLYVNVYNEAAILVINPITNVTDQSSLIVDAPNESWATLTYAPNTGKLYAPPYDADTLLVVDPTTNITENDTLTNFGNQRGKWVSCTFVGAGLDKIFCAPYNSPAVLVVDTAANTSDTQTLAGLPTGGNKWHGIAFAPVSNRLYCAPASADAVLIVDPYQNTTDTTTLTGLGNSVSKWYAVTYLVSIQRLFFTPFNADSILIVDPISNTMENTTLVIGTQGVRRKWHGAAVVPMLGRIYAAPYSARSVLSISIAVDTRVLSPFRQIASLASTLASTEADLVATQTALVASQASANATFATRTELIAVSGGVCNIPACGGGTREVNGSCVPDCANLRRRHVDCAPFCDGPISETDSSNAESDSATLTGVALGVAIGVILTLGITGAWHQRQRSQAHAQFPPRTSAMSVFINPALEAPRESFTDPPALDSQLYVSPPQGPGPYEQPVFALNSSAAEPVYDEAETSLGLDSQLYVVSLAATPTHGAADYEAIEDSV